MIDLDIYKLSKHFQENNVHHFKLKAGNSKETKYRLLFEAINSGKVNNDDEAKLYLQIVKENTFRKFKARYIRYLINFMFDYRANVFQTSTGFIDQYIDSFKFYTVSTIFAFGGNEKTAISLLRKSAQIAEKYQFFDILLPCLQKLKSHYGFIDPDKSLFLHYSTKLSEHQINRNMEDIVNHHYDQISFYYATNKQKAPEFKYDLEKAYKQLEAIKPAVSFISTLKKMYEVLTFYHMTHKNYAAALAANLEYTTKIQEDELTFNQHLYTAYSERANIYLAMQNYNASLEYVQKTLAILTKVSFNYFKLKGLEFMLYAETENYDKLYELVQEVKSKRKLKQYSMFERSWSLRLAYTFLFTKFGMVSAETIQAHGPIKFRLSKFVNDVSKFSTDKRGLNIAIIIIQLLHFLADRKYGKVTEQIDAISQYSHRYLKKNEQLRSNCFIKMLMKLPSAEYHPKRTQTYVKKYEKILRENPRELTFQSVELELFSYEKLWDIIIELLHKNNSKKIRSLN